MTRESEPTQVTHHRNRKHCPTTYALPRRKEKGCSDMKTKTAKTWTVH